MFEHHNTTWGTQSLSLHGESVEEKRQELYASFQQTWQLYERLFELISDESAFFDRPEPLRHPLIFYFAHTAVFFVNKLKLAGHITQRVNPDFEALFAVGVDEMSWDDLNDEHYPWPSVSDVRAYRSEVFDVVNSFIDVLPLTLPITQTDAAWVILMGIEHERIHLETSSVIMRQLPLSKLQHYSQDISPSMYRDSSISKLRWIPIPAQSITLGKSPHDDMYGWDNEYGHSVAHVEAFEASETLVTNQAYLAFVNAGGYENQSYWGEEGRAWLDYTQVQHPRFWIRKESLWYQRNLTNEIPLPLDWPVEVNQLEADAFCAWLREITALPIRLPTQCEWQALRQDVDDNTVSANHRLSHASSCSVWAHKQSDCYDVIGNVWQWTSTPIDGFTGFHVHPIYDDFSTPTFDGQHMLMKGGSWISTGNETLASSRYAFRRHFYQHAGFRLVNAPFDSQPSSLTTHVYETDSSVAQYLEFHYGDEYFDVPNFCVSAVKIARAHLPLLSEYRVLDLGCSVGRASFEWARYATHVDGVDFSARFIQQGCELLDKGCKRYVVPTEGDLHAFKEVQLSTLDYDDALLKRVAFSQGDACNLKPNFTNYDVVFASNLLDRLATPHAFLEHIEPRLQAGGYLVLLSLKSIHRNHIGWVALSVMGSLIILLKRCKMLYWHGLR